MHVHRTWKKLLKTESGVSLLRSQLTAFNMHDAYYTYKMFISKCMGDPFPKVRFRAKNV